MILYQLCCEDGHDFEAWFRDDDVYDRLAGQGRVECPYCGSTKVIRARMICDIFTARSAGVPEKISTLQTSMFVPTAEDDRKAQDVARRILNAVGKIHDYAQTHSPDDSEHFGGEDVDLSEDEDMVMFYLPVSHRRDH